VFFPIRASTIATGTVSFQSLLDHYSISSTWSRRLKNSHLQRRKNTTGYGKRSTCSTGDHRNMPNAHPNYPTARKQLISFLQGQGYRVHPREVYCPAAEHCWVDVAAVKGQDFWAFEYKSRNDSIKRGLSQCQAYANAFNYVVLVADRRRATSSPYFGSFKRNGFGVWSHAGFGFYALLKPQRRVALRRSRTVIERQFGWGAIRAGTERDRKISDWFSS
jgi:hypothetical protein